MPPSPTALRRIAKDTSAVMDLPSADGLFWIPHESCDLTRGYAIVCGCEGSPYHGGAFGFEVQFPENYPFQPPAFKFLTQDGKTRFNPNLYKNGKVCLSILNTWHGEPWTAVQSLLSILQCIQSAVLNENPLINEPSHPASTNIHNVDIPVYNRLVMHATLETAMYGQIVTPPPWLAHSPTVLSGIKAWAIRAFPDIVTKGMAIAEEYDGKTEELSFFAMGCKYQFAHLVKMLGEVLVDE